MKRIIFGIVCLVKICVCNLTVCDQTKKLYQSYACCGGEGNTYCSAEKINMQEVMGELQSIKSLLSQSSQQESVYLDELCFPDAPIETSTLGSYPPTEEREKFVDVDGYPSYGLDSNGSPLDHLLWPHIPGYAPYMGLCSSARMSIDRITRHCPSLGTAGSLDFYSSFVAATKTTMAFEQLSNICKNGARVIMVFSMILQFEYMYAHALSDSGKTYLNSVIKGNLDGPGAINFTDISTSYSGLIAPFQSVLSEEDWYIVELSSQTFKSHLDVALASARFTSGISIVAADRVPMALYGGTYYPDNFDICLASRRMWLFMTQNPTDFYPELGADKMYGDGYNYMFRCSSRGGKILKAQNDILYIEKMTASDREYCPTIQEVRDIVDPTSVLIYLSAEKYFFKSCLVSAECQEQVNGPYNAYSFWLMRDDVEYMWSLWVTFLHVHLNELKKNCGIEYVAADYKGTSLHLYSIDLLRKERTLQNTLYPVVEPKEYINPYKNCTDYGYENTGIPKESVCTLKYAAHEPRNISELPHSWREFTELYPGASEVGLCRDDPYGRMNHFYGDMSTEKVFDLSGISQMKKVFNLTGTDAVCKWCTAWGPREERRDLGAENYVAPYFIKSLVYADLYPLYCNTSCSSYTSPYCI